MSKPISIEGIGVSISDGPEQRSRALPEEGDSLGILVLGNFTGHASNKAGADFQLRRVDRDNLDSLPHLYGASLSLTIKNETGPDQTISLQFDELDHFHPDHIFDTLVEFQALKKLRRELGDPGTFGAAVREIQSWNPEFREEQTRKKLRENKGKKAVSTTQPEGGSVLDQIMSDDGATMETEPEQTAGNEVDRFVAVVVQPYLVPKENPRREEYQQAVDTACSALMNTILHHPDFQSLESAFRGVEFLIRRLETDDDLQVYILNANKEELLADLLKHENPTHSKLHTLLSRKAEIDKVHWGVISGLYSFGPSPQDATFLQLMGYVGQALQVSFIGQASSAILGCKDLAATPDYADWQPEKNREAVLIWQELRRFPFAANVGLAFPRFLLRNPYGEETDAIDRFFFEETEDIGHEKFLWGNSSLLCALLIGRAFNHSAWNFRAGEVQEVENLPSPIIKDGEETRLLPCAEVVFTHMTAEVILDAGLMPVLSMKDSDFARLARFQSVAEPLSSLSGPWRTS